MLKEHDRVVLLTRLPGEQLEAGDVGTIVHIYRDGLAYEAEFVVLDGKPRKLRDTVGINGMGSTFSPAA